MAQQLMKPVLTPTENEFLKWMVSCRVGVESATVYANTINRLHVWGVTDDELRTCCPFALVDKMWNRNTPLLTDRLRSSISKYQDFLRRDMDD